MRQNPSEVIFDWWWVVVVVVVVVVVATLDQTRMTHECLFRPRISFLLADGFLAFGGGSSIKTIKIKSLTKKIIIKNHLVLKINKLFFFFFKKKKYYYYYYYYLLFLLGFSHFPYTLYVPSTLLIAIVLLFFILTSSRSPHPTLSLSPSTSPSSVPPASSPLHITVLICLLFGFSLICSLFSCVSFPFWLSPDKPPLTIHPSIAICNYPYIIQDGRYLSATFISIRWPPRSASNTNLPGLLDYLPYWCWTLIL